MPKHFNPKTGKTGNCYQEDFDKFFKEETTQKSRQKFFDDKVADFTNALRSAVDKAHVLDTPITSYRGFKPEEFVETFSGEKRTESKEIIQKLLSGDFNGTTLMRSSNPGTPTRIASAPTSASLNPNRALKFTDCDRFDGKSYEYMCQIETRTMASPVNVSAWSSSESEILLNHNSDYEVLGAYEESYWDEDDSEMIVVIKLREILNP